MRILWFTNTPCGALKTLTGQNLMGGGWLSALADHLKNIEGIDLHIAFYWGKQIPHFTIDGITYHPVLREGDDSRLGRYVIRLKSQFAYGGSEKQVQRLLDVVNALEPDIIHIHGSEENFGLIAQHIDSDRIVLSIQGLLGPCFEKLYSGYSKSSILRKEFFLKKILFEGENANCRRFKLRVKDERIMFQHIHNIIGRTDWDKNCSLALNPSRHYYVVNELLRSEFYRTEWLPVINRKSYIIVTTVSNGLYKGVETIYKTADILKRANFDFVWKVIGVSSSDSIVKLTEKILGFGADGINIEFLGRRDASGMIEELCTSDIFVQVSHIENSPNSLCEAMILGMPIIASFAGGTSSILSDKEDGILIQDGDPFCLAGTIISSRSEYETMIKMGKNARNKALERHNHQNVANELLNVYNSVING